MFEQLFVDTGYIIALINETDRNHGQALALADKYDGYPLVTTDAVLLEIGNALSRIGRSQAVEIINYFQQAAEVTLVHLNPMLFRAAVRMFEQYADKTWGLVDCVSFLVMREMKITAVLGFDRHFVQAGFRLLEDT
jgi:hypothetical protein